MAKTKTQKSPASPVDPQLLYQIGAGYADYVEPNRTMDNVLKFLGEIAVDYFWEGKQLADKAKDAYRSVDLNIVKNIADIRGGVKSVIEEQVLQMNEKNNWAVNQENMYRFNKKSDRYKKAIQTQNNVLVEGEALVEHSNAILEIINSQKNLSKGFMIGGKGEEIPTTFNPGTTGLQYNLNSMMALPPSDPESIWNKLEYRGKDIGYVLPGEKFEWVDGKYVKTDIPFLKIDLPKSVDARNYNVKDDFYKLGSDYVLGGGVWNSEFEMHVRNQARTYLSPEGSGGQTTDNSHRSFMFAPVLSDGSSVIESYIAKHFPYYLPGSDIEYEVTDADLDNSGTVDADEKGTKTITSKDYPEYASVSYMGVFDTIKQHDLRGDGWGTASGDLNIQTYNDFAIDELVDITKNAAMVQKRNLRQDAPPVEELTGSQARLLEVLELAQTGNWGNLVLPGNSGIIRGTYKEGQGGKVGDPYLLIGTKRWSYKELSTQKGLRRLFGKLGISAKDYRKVDLSEFMKGVNIKPASIETKGPPWLMPNILEQSR